MNNCSKCGAVIKEGASFCGSCGTPVETIQNNTVEIDIKPTADLIDNQIPNNPVQEQNTQTIGVQVSTQNAMDNIQTFDSQTQQIGEDFQTSESYSDDELINAYMGKNAYKLKKGDFSIWTLLFGNIYIFYRKMFAVGFCWLFINLIANQFLKSASFYINLIISIIMSTQFKKMYLQHVEDKVEAIKAENKGVSREQLLSICTQKGGTTIIPVIIVGIVYVIVFISFFMMLLLLLSGIDL